MDQAESQAESQAYPLAYFRALEEMISTQEDLETAQKWVIWRMVSIALTYGGVAHVPVRTLAEEIGASRSIVGVVLSKLFASNPFQEFFAIEKPEPDGSYLIRLYPWHGNRARTMPASKRLPLAIRQLLVDLNEGEIAFINRHEVGNVKVVVVGTLGNASDSVPEKDIALS